LLYRLVGPVRKRPVEQADRSSGAVRVAASNFRGFIGFSLGDRWGKKSVCTPTTLSSVAVEAMLVFWAGR
jgi:hypothetical protein